MPMTDGLITQRVELLRKHLPADVHLHYAIKANPMPEVVRHLAALVDGLDVASAGELRIALASGMNPGAISFAGPGKTDAELAEATAAGIVVNLESEREMERIAVLGRNHSPATARGGAGQPRLRAEKLGDEDGRRSQAVWRGR